MTKQIINLGTAPGGTDGDTSRSAFTKINANFDELYRRTQAKLTKDVGGTAGTVALSADEAVNGIIDLTGALTGARTVTVPAAPAQTFTVRNSTTGAFSLTFQTASGSGVVIPSGQTSVLYSDGTNIVDPIGPAFTGRLIGVRIFTASGTYTPTSGTTSVIVEIQGAGGAGGGCPAASGNSSAGGGGGGGGYVKHRMTSGFSGASVVVGAGGVGNASSAGGSGGASSFAGIVASGGGGGQIAGPAAAPVAATPGSGGAASGGNIFNRPGGHGRSGVVHSNTAVSLGVGADSLLGRGGQGQVAADGIGGVGYGAGGGGPVTGGTATTGGPGAAGLVIIWEYA
ncbi:hypothetical protein [Pandoraea sputorum]|uniref:hypothetical protein n=1 Tax=Pandoraea sputorum TaxID=93222 RepID=UPI0012417BC9|nr:hypothetical protein [Pandoraea sputorum]VVE78196.1 hypothetical protein PSP31120_01555 [Pandoraea sputorum]